MDYFPQNLRKICDLKAKMIRTDKREREGGRGGGRVNGGKKLVCFQVTKMNFIKNGGKSRISIGGNESPSINYCKIVISNIKMRWSFNVNKL